MANNDIKNQKGSANEQTGIESMNESLASFSVKVEKNKKPILYAVAIILAVVLAGFGWYFYNRHQNNKSAQVFSAKMVEAVNEAQKQAKTSSSPDSIYNAVMAKKMQEAAQAESGKIGATLANLQLAAIYYEQGKAKEALAALAATDIDEPIMKMNADLLKGDCDVALNKANDALNIYNAVYEEAKEKNPEIATRALMKKASVLDSQKKYGDALAVYQLIQKDYPQYAQVNIDAYVERESARAGK